MKFIYGLIASLLVTTAFAADWTQVGASYTKKLDDGTVWNYATYYSPSSVVRNGSVVSVTIETVNSSATKVFFDELNCTTHQYRIAPAGTTLSELRDVQPNTLGTDLIALLCR